MVHLNIASPDACSHCKIILLYGSDRQRLLQISCQCLLLASLCLTQNAGQCLLCSHTTLACKSLGPHCMHRYTYRDCRAWRSFRAALGTVFSWLFESILSKNQQHKNINLCDSGIQERKNNKHAEGFFRRKTVQHLRALLTGFLADSVRTGQTGRWMQGHFLPGVLRRNTEERGG